MFVKGVEFYEVHQSFLVKSCIFHYAKTSYYGLSTKLESFPFNFSGTFHRQIAV